MSASRLRGDAMNDLNSSSDAQRIVCVVGVLPIPGACMQPRGKKKHRCSTEKVYNLIGCVATLHKISDSIIAFQVKQSASKSRTGKPRRSGKSLTLSCGFL